MPIIGLGLNSIEASKKNERVEQQEVKVNSTPHITDVKEVDLPNFSQKALSIEFDFLTVYDPALAKITIKGTVMYLSDNIKDVVTEWKKKKRLPEDMSMEVLNYLFRHCLLKSSVLADELQLPPPMPMPRITPKKE